MCQACAGGWKHKGERLNTVLAHKGFSSHGQGALWEHNGWVLLRQGVGKVLGKKIRRKQPREKRVEEGGGRRSGQRCRPVKL